MPSCRWTAVNPRIDEELIGLGEFRHGLVRGVALLSGKKPPDGSAVPANSRDHRLWCRILEKSDPRMPMADKPNRDSPPPAMDAVVQSPKLTEIVAGMLRHKIVTGELAQGDFLPPEPELMVQLGVSRPTLREALRVLESESLIKPRRGSRTGAQVQAPSIDLVSRYMGFVLQYEGVTLEDVQQARRTLEPPIAGMLAARRDPHAIVQLRELLEREESCLNDDFSFGHASVRFHERSSIS